MPSIKPVSDLKNYTNVVSQVSYGNREPVLAFSAGLSAAFSSAVNVDGGQTKSRPVIRTVNDAEKKTSDMLSDIENIYKKNEQNK